MDRGEKIQPRSMAHMYPKIAVPHRRTFGKLLVATALTALAYSASAGTDRGLSHSGRQASRSEQFGLWNGSGSRP